MRRVDPQGRILFPRTSRALVPVERHAGLADVNGYYKILRVESDASEDDIRRAFRRLARSAHPDAGGSVDEFLLLVEAYTILTDSQQRAIYDSAESGRYISGSELGNALATSTKISVDTIRLVLESAVGAYGYSYYVDGVEPDIDLLVAWTSALLSAAWKVELDTELRLVLAGSGVTRVERSPFGVDLIYINQSDKPDKTTINAIIDRLKHKGEPNE